jgi:xanthine dehydrogenase iron-sulfur cluster and FAD-binding subunit A
MSLDTIRHQIEDDHRALSEKLNDINAIVGDKSADEERTLQIQECIAGLSALREVPLLTVEHARKAQETMHSLRDT